MKIRDELTKKEFIEYLDKYPQYRFWQAICNFWEVPFVGISNDLKEWKDTFYIEGDELIHIKKSSIEDKDK